MTLEKTLQNSIGGKCAFPENLAVPTNPNFIKIESGQNGDPTDDARFRRNVLYRTITGQLSIPKAVKILKAV